MVLLGVELLYFRVADYFNIIDKPNERSSHTRITLRGGGIVFYMGVLVYFIASEFSFPWFMLGLTLIAGVSFVDDVRSVTQRVRLVVHFVAMLLMFYQWGMVSLPWWYVVVALVVCTGIINAYNFMDGINGITGGYSLVVLGGLAYVNGWGVPFVDEKMIYTMMVAVLVFDGFNFRRKAKCFAGDVGAVSIHRLMLHENIELPHRKHMYQLMANELKIPHVVVSLVYMGVQAVIVAVYLAMPGIHYACLGGSVAVLGIGYVLFMRKYFKLHLVVK